MLFTRLYGEPENPTGPDDKTLIGFYTYHADGPPTRGDIAGCKPPDNDMFCPTETVTRGQMAAFVHRADG